ncbi:MAG TPA: hypothetical protein P5161_04040, partial [Eubacteriales bacterium]|nr:hypothetical protein [Eubacteriales bacterium]
FPLVGLILYLVWRDEKPRTARIAGKGALAWLILCVSLVVLTIIIVVIVIATDYDYSEGAALLSHISGLFV